LLPGYVIHALNGRSVTNLAGLRRVREPLGLGDAVVLQFGRARGLLFVTLTLE
jgi:S1-C subfamily serine protease